MALPWTVRPTNAAASTRPANARNTAATLRPKRTRGDRRRGRELTRASWGTGELRGKRIARIPRSAVRAPPDHPEPRDGGATVAELAGERRHDHRTIAPNDGGVVARFVERPGLVRHLRGVREVTQEPEHATAVDALADTHALVQIHKAARRVGVERHHEGKLDHRRRGKGLVLVLAEESVPVGVGGERARLTL